VQPPRQRRTRAERATDPDPPPPALSRTLTSWGVSWGPAVLWAAVLFFLSATPDFPGGGLLRRIPGGDKLVHLALYAVLGVALAWGRRRHWRSAPPSLWVHAALILAGALYGVSDEWHQSFVPGRDASALDWLADLCGVTLGYFAASASSPDREPV
jgi:VanZ family protein